MFPERALFNAKTGEYRPTYVDLPPEHPESGKGVALLLQHIYGTLCAADGRQEEYSCSMVNMTFRQGMVSPCASRHRSSRVVCVVRGGGFTSAGPSDALEKIKEETYC